MTQYALPPLLMGLLIVCTVGVLVLVLLVAYAIHKLRRLHVSSFALLDDAAWTRKEVASLFAQLQAFQSLDSVLDLSRPLPPLRGWAASPDFLMATYDEILRRTPKVVVECSSGVSTVVIARTLQQIGSGHVFSLEHDTGYASQTRELLERFGLTAWATVLDSPLQTRSTSTPWYDLDVLPEAAQPIDLVVVDGPPETVAELAREPAFAQLRSRLSDRCAIFLDDADRPDETETLRRWQTAEPRLSVRRIATEKGMAVVEYRHR